MNPPSLNHLKETPTQRIHETGALYVSNLELLGALIGNSDAALHLLHKYETLRNIAAADLPDLLTIPGLGKASAARVKAAFEIGRRQSLAAPDERVQVRSPADAAKLLMGEMSLLRQEELRVILLDTRSRVLGTATIYKGSLNTSIIRTAEIFREAIQRNASAIILAHNHPSGDPSPSQDDLSTTRDIITTGNLLDIEVMDHIVIGQQRFVSLKERGLAFS